MRFLGQLYGFFWHTPYHYHHHGWAWDRIDCGLNLKLRQNWLKILFKILAKNWTLSLSTISEFWRSGELGRKNVSKLKNHAKYGNCQNIFLTYHCDNYPLFQNSYFRFYCQQPVVLIIFGAYYSVALPDVSWIDFGKWATFQKRKWFSFKRCHQELQLANESVLDIHSSKSQGHS